MTDPVRRSGPPRKRAPSHRARLRAAGLRPVQIWVPDTTDPDFAEKVRAQARALAKSDPAGEEIMDWIEAVYEAPEWKE